MRMALNTAWLNANQANQSTTQEVEHLSWEKVLDWVTEQEIYPKIVWHSRNDDRTIFGLGIGVQNNSKRFIVQSFDQKEPQWPFFPSEMTWTPQFIVEWSNERLLLHSSEKGAIWTPPNGVDLNEQEHLPIHSQWIKNIEECKRLFEDSILKKIVLARQSKCSIQDPINAFKDIVLRQSSCYHFLFIPNELACFFGASPEKLFSLNGSTLQTEALAGTTEVKGVDETDMESAKILMESSKDQWEHTLVLNYLTNQLDHLSIDHICHPQEIVRLTNVQHLRTRSTFTLCENTQLIDVLNRLHPTPAVCGLPKDEARVRISELEPFHRGWYAGTLGFIEDDQADFTVMIRSALWLNGQGYTWSGAGIVSQSDPLLEWMEINNKAKQFLDKS